VILSLIHIGYYFTPETANTWPN